MRPGSSPPAATVDKRRYPIADLVADVAYLIEWKPLRIAKRPINSLQTGNVWTGIAASHRDKQRRTAREFIGQRLWLARTEIDPDVTHDVDDFRMHAFGRLGAGGHRLGSCGIGDGREEGGRHLGAAGIVHTRENHSFGHGLDRYRYTRAACRPHARVDGRENVMSIVAPSRIRMDLYQEDRV